MLMTLVSKIKLTSLIMPIMFIFNKEHERLFTKLNYSISSGNVLAYAAAMFSIK